MCKSEPNLKFYFVLFSKGERNSFFFGRKRYSFTLCIILFIYYGNYVLLLFLVMNTSYTIIYLLSLFLFFLFFERLLVLNINSTRRLLGIFFSLGERNGYTIRLLPLSLLFVISKQLDRLEDS